MSGMADGKMKDGASGIVGDSNKVQEEAFLVGDSNYLHLKKNVDGFSYEAFHAGQPRKIADGQIYTEQIEKSSVRSPIAAARTLAIEQTGLDGGRVAKVSIYMLERFVDSDVRRRRYREPGSLPKNDIRFITSDYKELFRIPDGGTIMVDYPDRHYAAHCEHLDDFHTRINGEVFHICQFAEILERNGGTCRPEPEMMQEEAAWRLGTKNYLTIYACEGSWDYTIYDQNFHPADGGLLDRPEMSILEARDQIMQDFGMQNRSRTPLGYDFVVGKAEAAMEAESGKNRASVLEKLEVKKENRAEKSAHTEKNDRAVEPKVSVPKRHGEVL